MRYHYQNVVEILNFLQKYLPTSQNRTFERNYLFLLPIYYWHNNPIIWTVQLKPGAYTLCFPYFRLFNNLVHSASSRRRTSIYFCPVAYSWRLSDYWSIVIRIRWDFVRLFYFTFPLHYSKNLNVVRKSSIYNRTQSALQNHANFGWIICIILK